MRGRTGFYLNVSRRRCLLELHIIQRGIDILSEGRLGMLRQWS